MIFAFLPLPTPSVEPDMADRVGEEMDREEVMKNCFEL